MTPKRINAMVVRTSEGGVRRPIVGVSIASLVRQSARHEGTPHSAPCRLLRDNVVSTAQIKAEIIDDGRRRAKY
jgi:hypothetical protein